MSKLQTVSEPDRIRVLSPTAILGYGFPESSFRKGLEKRPDVIAVDAGSTDPGPYYLGAGVSFTNRAAVRRDLELILSAGRELDVPVVIGSAGGAGARPHLDWTLDIVREVAQARRLEGRLAVIPADMGRENVLSAFRAGTVEALTPGQTLCEEDIASSTHIVAQMGEEPIVAALEDGADVVVAGRCYDPAVFAALPVIHGFDRGLALHMGKILECAAIAARPGSGSDCMFATLERDAFTVEPLADERACTVESVAGHTLYEKGNPYILPGPGGWLDLRDCRFEQVNERRVRVSGTRFVADEHYKVKLEAARPRGFRTVSLAGARDPVFIAQVDAIIEGVKRRTAENFPAIDPASYAVSVRVYGRDGVMGALEPCRENVGHEVAIVMDVTAATQDLANTLCAFMRSTMLHFGFPGRLATGGNLALPYSPSDFSAGAVFAFSLYHLMPVANPTALFAHTMTRLEAFR